jgi:hypothetical protein
MPYFEQGTPNAGRDFRFGYIPLHCTPNLLAGHHGRPVSTGDDNEKPSTMACGWFDRRTVGRVRGTSRQRGDGNHPATVAIIAARASFIATAP